MKLIVALGNPGAKYTHTRHNAGWLALDTFIERNSLPEPKEKTKFKSAVAEHTAIGEKLVLAKPLTFMNKSGEAIQVLMKYYDVQPDDMLVVYDELMQPFGALRLRKNGSSAGHNGVQSVISSVGEGFWRLRIGVHNEQAERMPREAFVLSTFTPDEFEKLPEVTVAAANLIHRFIDGTAEPETVKVSFSQ